MNPTFSFASLFKTTPKWATITSVVITAIWSAFIYATTLNLFVIPVIVFAKIAGVHALVLFILQMFGVDSPSVATNPVAVQTAQPIAIESPVVHKPEINTINPAAQPEVVIAPIVQPTMPRPASALQPVKNPGSFF